MYTTQERVRRALAPELDGQPSPEQGTTAASLSDADIDEFIEVAQRRVDLFLGQRYTVPFVDPVDPIIIDLTTAVAAYEATLAFYGGTDIQEDDPVIRRYKDARGILGQLSTGLLVIGAPENTNVEDDPIVINPATCVFGPGELEYRFVREGRHPW